MLNAILPMIQSHPKVKHVVENIFNQPVDHVFKCFGVFMDNVGRGPGLHSAPDQKLALFNRIYKGGLSLGFADWYSELAAAKIAGYTDLDIAISFQDRHNWKDATIERIAALSEQVMPRFVEKAKTAGLLPPEMFPQSGIPKTDVTTSGGVPPWDQEEYRSGANDVSLTNNAPKI